MRDMDSEPAVAQIGFESWGNLPPHRAKWPCYTEISTSRGHRTARSPHYDGVPANRRDPAVIAVFGLGLVDVQLVDPTQPSWRQV